MTILVFMVVILAAVMHALWNAMVKSQPDKLLTMTAIVIGAGTFGAISLFFVGLPHSDSYGYLAVAIIIHIGYQIFLSSAYSHGDLSLVYPISRGTAPLIVTLYSILVLGIQFELTTMFGLGLIICAVFCLVFAKTNNGQNNGKAIKLALITACFIATYSLVDGFGARAAGDAVAFYSSLALINGIGFTLFVRVKNPDYIKTIFTRQKIIMLVGGGASFIAFTLVMWAFTQTHIATVSALREVSIIFAMFIGVLIFKEKFSWLKIVAIIITLAGMVLLRI